VIKKYAVPNTAKVCRRDKGASLHIQYTDATLIGLYTKQLRMEQNTKALDCGTPTDDTNTGFALRIKGEMKDAVEQRVAVTDSNWFSFKQLQIG